MASASPSRGAAEDRRGRDPPPGRGRSAGSRSMPRRTAGARPADRSGPSGASGGDAEVRATVGVGVEEPWETREAKRVARGRERPLAGVTAIAMALEGQSACHRGIACRKVPAAEAPAFPGPPRALPTRPCDSAQLSLERPGAVPVRIGTEVARLERCRSCRGPGTADAASELARKLVAPGAKSDANSLTDKTLRRSRRCAGPLHRRATARQLGQARPWGSAAPKTPGSGLRAPPRRVRQQQASWPVPGSRVGARDAGDRS